MEIILKEDIVNLGYKNDAQRRRIPHRSQRQVVQRKRDDKNDREQEKCGDLPRFSAQIL